MAEEQLMSALTLSSSSAPRFVLTCRIWWSCAPVGIVGLSLRRPGFSCLVPNLAFLPLTSFQYISGGYSTDPRHALLILYKQQGSLGKQLAIADVVDPSSFSFPPKVHTYIPKVSIPPINAPLNHKQHISVCVVPVDGFEIER